MSRTSASRLRWTGLLRASQRPFARAGIAVVAVGVLVGGTASALTLSPSTAPKPLPAATAAPDLVADPASAAAAPAAEEPDPAPAAEEPDPAPAAEEVTTSDASEDVADTGAAPELSTPDLPAAPSEEATEPTEPDDGAAPAPAPSETDDPGGDPAAEEADGDGTTGESGPDDAAPSDPGLTFVEAVAIHGAPDYVAILIRRYPGAQWSLSGDRYAGLDWLDATPKPSKAELDAHWPTVAVELAAERAAREADEAAAAAAREAELEARRNDPSVQELVDSFDPRIIWGPEPHYSHILVRRFPGVPWSLSGNDPDTGLVWMGDGPKPTRAQLDAMWADVAREMALELDPVELERWAGTGDLIYVDGVLRPRGWIGGANDAQPHPIATRDNLQYLPQIPNTNGGSPVDSILVRRDPTGAKNFEQLHGVRLHELGALIAEAHGFFGGSFGVGLGLSGDRELMWYSDLVERAIVKDVLRSIGALDDED